MILHKGETLFRQGVSGPLYRLRKGMLKIVRLHEDGTPTLVNLIVPGETIPHHSLIRAYVGFCPIKGAENGEIAIWSGFYPMSHLGFGRIRQKGLARLDKIQRNRKKTRKSPF